MTLPKNLMKKLKTQENNFDRGKIYYPLIMNYIFSLHGFIDLVSRGLIRQLAVYKNPSSRDIHDKLIESLNISDVDVKNEFKNIKKPAPLFVKQGFLKSDGKKIRIDINEIADETVKEAVYLTSTLNNSACILFISAFEKTKEWDDQKDPIWNFFIIAVMLVLITVSSKSQTKDDFQQNGEIWK